MGRYDKIKPHNGSSYVQPTECYVHDGTSWVNFSANTDIAGPSNREIYVHNGTTWVKETLNGKKYLNMTGQNGIQLGNIYQFYKFHFEIEVEFTALSNQMIFESYVDSTHYARIGLYENDGFWYVYFKGQYGNYVGELSTLYATNKESIKTDTKYKLVLDNSNGSMTGTVTNTASNLVMTIRTSGGATSYSIGGFYGYSGCKSALFGGSQITNRPMKAKIYSCKIATYGMTTTVNGGEYLNDNIIVGSSTWAVTNAQGSGSALNVTGIFVSEWY